MALNSGESFSFMIETFKITIYQIGAGQGWWLSKGPTIHPKKESDQYIDEKILTRGYIFALYHLHEQMVDKGRRKMNN